MAIKSASNNSIFFQIYAAHFHVSSLGPDARVRAWFGLSQPELARYLSLSAAALAPPRPAAGRHRSRSVDREPNAVRHFCKTSDTGPSSVRYLCKTAGLVPDTVGH